MIDWNDTIVITFFKDKNKLVVPKSAIRSLGTQRKRDYSKPNNDEYEVTVLIVDSEWAYNAGMDFARVSARQDHISLEVDMDLKAVLGLLRGDKAAEVLF